MRTAALVAASSFNAEASIAENAKRPYDEIVAVDGGYAHLHTLGIKPTLAVGDFDSLGFVPADMPSLTFSEEKDKSDLALAFEWCAQTSFDGVSVYDAFAGRLDHTLAALQSMAAYACLSPTYVEGIAAQERLVVLPCGCQLFISAAAQTRSFCLLPKDQRAVSVIALTDRVEGLSVEGMKYTLRKGALTNRMSLGLSNELVGQEARISVEEGCVVVVLPLSQICTFEASPW